MRYNYFLYFLIAFLLFLFLYNPSHLYFLSDDFESMYNSLGWHYVLHSYRFTSDFFLLTDHAIWGNSATGYHLTNLFFHFANTIILFLVTRKILSKYQQNHDVDRQAFFTSLLFLFYAYHSESVFWIVGRASILAGFFILSSLYFFLKKEKGKPYYFLSLLFFSGGLFSYESTWIIPLLMMIFAFANPGKNDLKKDLTYSLGYWIVFGGYLVARFYLTATVVGTPYGTEAVVTYNFPSLIKNYAALFSRSFQPSFHSVTVYVLGFILLLLLLCVIYIKTRAKWNRLTYVLCIMFLACLLPTITLGINTHNTESERFLYLPSVFLCIIIVQVIGYLFKQRSYYVLSCLLLINIVMLLFSFTVFEKASIISRASVQAIKKTESADTLYCVQLPLQYEGGFIFRNGFESAVKLYNPKIRNVVFLSKSGINPEFTNDYGVQYQDLKSIDSLQLPVRFNANNCRRVLFSWTADKLLIYK